jgi:y4mF family transcriptional regulator
MLAIVDIEASMKIKTARDVGAAIRDARKRRGWDQQKLAQEVGVSRQWIIDIEKGKPGAGIGLVLRTLDAVGVPFDLKTSTPTQDVTSGHSDLNINNIITNATRRVR